MNYTTDNFVRERGLVRVAWVCLGEGYNGDYDPKNLEDELLLRFDVAVKDQNIGDFVTIESRRTCFAANAPAKDKDAALDVLMDCFYRAYTSDSHLSISSLANELSYISADTYKELAGESGETTDTLILA